MQSSAHNLVGFTKLILETGREPSFHKKRSSNAVYLDIFAI